MDSTSDNEEHELARVWWYGVKEKEIDLYEAGEVNREVDSRDRVMGIEMSNMWFSKSRQLMASGARHGLGGYTPKMSLWVKNQETICAIFFTFWSLL